MAAILQLRRSGTPSTTIAEPFFNTGSNTLQIGTGGSTITLVKIGSNPTDFNTGNIILTGNLVINGGISGSSLYITGDTKIDGDLRLGGNIFLGSGSDGDLINVNATLSGSLIPDEDGVFDLGSDSYKYRNLYVLSASIDNISLPGSNIVSSSQQISNYDVFLEKNGDGVFSGSSQVNADTITNFDSNVKDKMNTDGVISGSSQVLIDSVDGFTSYSESVDDRFDIIETFTSSQENLNQTFATTGSNTFIGNQIVTGSLDIVDGEFSILTGSGALTSSLNFVHTTIDPITGNATLELRYRNNDVGPENNAWKFMASDSGVALIFEQDGVDRTLLSNNDAGDVLIFRDTRLFGKGLTVDNNLTITGSLSSSGSANFRGDVTASIFTGSFVGDGSGLTGVTAGDVEFENILNKPTLVSGSSQINVNNTENFQDFSSSVDSRLDYLEGDFSTSVDFRLDNLELTGSDHEFRIDGLETYTGSNDTLNTTQNNRLSYLETYTGSNDLNISKLFSSSSQYQSFSSSIDTTIKTKLNVEGIFSSSVQVDADTITNFDSNVKDKMNTDGVISGSSQVQINSVSGFTSFSSSVDSRLDNIEDYTSSLQQAIDVNGQNLTIYGNLVVQGDTTTLHTSELLIEDKVLSLASGSITSAQADGAGLHISGADASILWNDVEGVLEINQKVSSSVGFKGDGSELTGVTAADVEFENILNKPTLVSGSSQISFNGIVDKPTLFSGSSQVNANDVTNFDSNVKDKLNDDGVISGSSQVTSSLDIRYLEVFGNDVVSGSAQIDISGSSDYIVSIKSRLNAENVISGSSQVQINSVSGFTTFSSSVDGRLDNLESFTSSQETKNSNLATYTSSVDGRFDTLKIYTQSIDSDLSILHLYTQSNDTKFSNLQSYTESVDGRFNDLQTYTESIDSKFDILQTYTESIDSDLSILHLYTQSNDLDITNLFGTSSQYQSFSESIDSIIKDKIDLEGVVSSSSDSSTIDFTITDGVISGDVIGGVVSGSDQLTASLDGLYEVSGSVSQLVGIHQVSGSLGSAAWYNVSASISDGNPQVLGNAGAVRDYIDEQLLIIGAGDITEVFGYDGITGGAFAGPVSLSLDTASAHFTDGVNEAILPFSSSVSSSIAALESSSGYINYVTNSIEQLTGIEVADFDSNVAVTFIGGTLKFIFGAPALPSSISTSLSGFLTDRFNNVDDVYVINGNWTNGGYTLISASLYEGSTLLTEVSTGTSLSFTTTTSGSHTYRLELTGSSPLDGSIFTSSATTTGTISKSNPVSPTLTPTATVQLGASSNQIEQGATGSISYTSSSSDPSNGWDLVDVTTNFSTPYLITGSATGSSSISIIATADYESPIGDNNPDLTIQRTTTQTFTKIRSLRHGASTSTSFNVGELENISTWDTTLGGDIGTIVKGTTTPSGQSVTISWSGDKYHYIIFDSAKANLTNITTSGFGVFGTFESVTTVGEYKVYRTNTLQAGGAGSSITYTLT